MMPFCHTATLAALLALIGALHAAPKLAIHSGGQLTLAGGATLTVNDGNANTDDNIQIQSGGIMRVATGSVTNATILEVQELGLLIGCGTINAALLNHGTVIADCGTNPGLEFQQASTNNGEVVLRNGTTLTSDATFTNNGTWDARYGDNTLPAGFADGGGDVLLTGSTKTICKITDLTLNGSDVEVSAYTSLAYDYHMEWSDELMNWFDVGANQPGGGTITFKHINGASAATKRFYRLVEVNP